uniref:Uncharacterized protein n=1 Tax=Lepeophtheirus salmonis TaxID=72036 RepID=A0A0K2V6S3_LEPSM
MWKKITSSFQLSYFSFVKRPPHFMHILSVNQIIIILRKMMTMGFGEI